MLVKSPVDIVCLPQVDLNLLFLIRDWLSYYNLQRQTSYWLISCQAPICFCGKRRLVIIDEVKRRKRGGGDCG